MRIVLLGAGGQLAHELRAELAADEVLPWTRAECDLAAPDGLHEKLSAARPDAAVNAAAYNLVDQAEREPAAAFAANAFGPLELARACARLDVPLLHFSTDYVFTGVVGQVEPWSEAAAPQPASVYGLSKLAGEHAVRAYCPRSFVVRTCGLYGVKGSRGKGGNFVETMLRLADGGKPVRVVGDQRCTPSSCADVAAAAVRLLRTDAYGIHHATNAGSCTWHEFAAEIFRLAGKTVELHAIGSAEFAAPARRPTFSVLSSARLAEVGIALPDWRDALRRYLAARPAR